jgi:hypothetical protein
MASDIYGPMHSGLVLLVSLYVESGERKFRDEAESFVGRSSSPRRNGPFLVTPPRTYVKAPRPLVLPGVGAAAAAGPASDARLLR